MHDISVAVLDHNNIVPDMSDEFNILKEKDAFKANAIVMWNGINPFHQRMAIEARDKGIVTFVIQHGAGGWKDFYAPHLTNVSDYFVVWGSKSYEESRKRGWEKERLLRMGSNCLSKIIPHKPDGRTVIFAPEIETESSIKLWEILNTMDDINPVVKLVFDRHDPKNYKGNVVITDRDDSNHLDECYKTLENASCVVNDVKSTFDFIAYSMDVPVVKVLTEGNGPAGAYMGVGIENLEGAIRYSILNPGHLRAERRQMTIDYLGDVNVDNPKQTLVNKIREVVNV